MNWEKIKETLNLDKINTSDLPAGAGALLAIIAMVIALKSGKTLFKILYGLAAILLLVAAAWWHLHNR